MGGNNEKCLNCLMYVDFCWIIRGRIKRTLLSLFLTVYAYWLASDRIVNSFIVLNMIICLAGCHVIRLLLTPGSGLFFYPYGYQGKQYWCKEDAVQHTLILECALEESRLSFLQYGTVWSNFPPKWNCVWWHIKFWSVVQFCFVNVSLSICVARCRKTPVMCRLCWITIAAGIFIFFYCIKTPEMATVSGTGSCLLSSGRQ